MTGQTPGSAGQGIKKVFATGLTETADYDKEGVGAIRFEGNKIYKWVKYNAGAGSVAAVAGDVVGYYAAGGDGASGGYKNHEVTMDLTDVAEIGAGVLQAAIPNANWGWIQIRGAATLTSALVAGTDGDPLTMTGAGDGTLDLATGITDHICAWAFDASAKEIICDFPF